MGGRRRLTSLRLFWLIAMLVSLCAHSQGPQTIQLTVDYNDGVQKQFLLPYKMGMTVFDALTAAKGSPHGLTFDCDRKFPCSGAPPNRMLGNIDDVNNQGGGKSSKNWQFWVNNIYADQGFGVCKIAPDDKLLWKFDTYHDEKPGKACR